MLPALPEKGIPSTVDGGEPKQLSPLDTLEAHQKGAAVMAASPDGRFMATGGADGLVCLWMVYENQVGGQIEVSILFHNGLCYYHFCSCRQKVRAIYSVRRELASHSSSIAEPTYRSTFRLIAKCHVASMQLSLQKKCLQLLSAGRRRS